MGLLDVLFRIFRRIRLSKEVFIIHGRDEINKNALKEMLSSWGLKPVILAEQTNRGRTLIQKLIDHTSDVGYVFVLMTPDDECAGLLEFAGFMKDFSDFSKSNEGDRKRLLDQFRQGKYDRVILGSTPSAERLSEYGDVLVRAGQVFRKRVRQNVMFEYGLCIGSLGTKRVCQLVKGDIQKGEIEIPSDILGYGYTQFKDSVSEIEERIRRELEDAGYRLDVKIIDSSHRNKKNDVKP